MPRLEVQSFLDFAPHYFTYITGAVQQKVRLCLGFVFLQVTVRQEAHNFFFFCTTETDCTGKDPGCLPDWLQELSEQHGEETGPARDGKSLLRTQDGSGISDFSFQTALFPEGCWFRPVLSTLVLDVNRTCRQSCPQLRRLLCRCST